MKRTTTDPRFGQIHDQIALGHVQKFEDLIKIIPKTLIAQVIGTNGNRITRLILNPEEIGFKDLVKLSDAINIPLIILSKLTVNGILSNKGESLIPIKGIYKKKQRIQQELTFLTPIEE